jgi:protein-S-isoprenylcysteine O-methyltransferase Ste14
MNRLAPVLGSLVFLVIAPGVVAGLIPAAISGWEGDAPFALQLVGWIALTAGVVALLVAFARFALEGLGTPAPVAPTERLVVSGSYRHVRNPMYLAVVAIILGQAAILGNGWLVVYAAVVWATVAVFVLAYEEPTLAATYGPAYDAYRAAVPAWIPRLRPWEGESA